MSDHHSHSSTGDKRTIQQLPVPARKDHDAIFNAEYLVDIVAAVKSWGCQRIVLVHSKALDENTDVIKKLEAKLGSVVVGKKSGVGAHSPYSDVLAIATLLNEHHADCLISVGSSSYSDASKIARLMQANLDSKDLTAEAMEGLIDQHKGHAEDLKDPGLKLILVPTSLSASEWNNNSSATNPQSKKQHFSSKGAAPDLILLDPKVASTSPRKLWLSSGMRAVDHCVETMVNEECNKDVFQHMEDALATLLRGLKEHREGETEEDRTELLDGISQCQLGSRNAMMGLLLNDIPMGASHAIGHQLGSVCGVMHGVTSCIMLSPVLRYTYTKTKQQREAQDQVLSVWNKTLRWEERSLADAVRSFVKMLDLPSTLKDVGVQKQEDIEKIADQALTDVLGAKQGLSKDDVLEILNTARG
jgi:alcohol dehydrogenase class IV